MREWKNIQNLHKPNQTQTKLCLTRVAHNSLATDKPVALEFPIELEFGSVGFCGGRKTGEPGEKPSEQGREPTTNSTHIWYRAGIEPGPHWWEASALTTAPSLLPIQQSLLHYTLRKV